jgi:DNA-binding beta-propeller fold protein YncE
MKHFITTLLLSLCYLTSGSVFSAPTAENYRFERLWPMLPQPWYFDRARHLAVDQQGNVYVTNQLFKQLRKFTADGHLVRQWVFEEEPVAIQASRKTDQVYVTYDKWLPTGFGTSTVRVFNAAGEVVTKWDEKPGLLAAPFALDSNDNLYLLNNYVVYSPSGEPEAHQPILQKFTADGQLVSKWPIEPPVKPRWGIELAIDSQHGIYVLYSDDNRLLKYELTDQNRLRKVQEWGDFKNPSSVALDAQDNVYVSDTDNNRIKKLSADGSSKDWIVNASDSGVDINVLPFSPLAITPDLDVFSLIRELLPKELDQNFTKLLDLWKTVLDFSRGPQKLFYPEAIAVGGQSLYVKVKTAFLNETIQKYYLHTGNGDQETGVFQTEWRSQNTGKGQVYAPFDIARDSQGYLYVTDTINHRVLKFDDQGKFITTLGKPGVAPGEFILPLGVTVDNHDNLYVVDTGNLRIQQFDANGKFIKQLGGIDIPKESASDSLNKFTYIFRHSELVLPIDVAVDSHSNIYVVDMGRNQVKKFTSSGKLVETFKQSPLGKGTMGEAEGELKIPFNITIDNHDNLFVVDAFNYRLQQFTTDGDYVRQWKRQCLLGKPMSVATDNEGYLYVHVAADNAIIKLKLNDTTRCKEITHWGENGLLPGQIGDGGGLAVSPHGERVFMVDSDYNRIQVFQQGFFTGGKAIIVAGGGPGSDNNQNGLWESTQAVANFAYRTLTYQGFTKEAIYYLSDAKEFDLDGNGENDDIDAVHTKANLEYAITQWAADTEDLMLYLTDHGGPGSFGLNDNKAPLESSVTAEELAGWLKIWQDKHPKGLLKVIYDACHSGSFKDALVGDNRIIITSAATEESAYFLSQGALSFSNYFWTNIFYGLSITEAFTQAQETVKVGSKLRSGQQQTPAIVAQVKNLDQLYLGNGTKSEGKAPIITLVSSSLSNNTATITAEVSDADGIDRVWAMIVPPSSFGDFEFSTRGRTVVGLPSCELSRQAGGNVYKTDCDKFSATGEYDVAIYARDSQQNTSIPTKITIVNESGARRKAIIVVAGDEETVNNYREIAESSKLVYEALRYQGYSQEDIWYLSNVPIAGVVKDSGIPPANRFNLVDVGGALKQWARDHTQDLVIYLIGLGDDTQVRLNAKETLTFAELKAALDTLQELDIPGPVTVIYEGPQSGYLLPALKTPPAEKKRVVISSTGISSPKEGSPLLTFAFSKQFWQKIINGANVLLAFNDAHGITGETAQLDDNGDGSYNTNDDENRDGQVANGYTMGIGIVSAEQPQSVPICVHQLASMTTTTCKREHKIQVELPVLAANQVQYVGVQTPNGNLLVIKAFNRAVPFERIETMPVWEGTGKLAMDIEANTVLPLGEYRFYRLEVPKGTLLNPAGLSKLEESVLKLEE